MNSLSRYLTILLMAALVFAVNLSPAEAGRSCEPRKLNLDSLNQASQAALRLEKELDQVTGETALVARVGSDLSDHGLKYSHAGIARKLAGQEKWVVTHQLNQCGSDQSKLYDHGLLQFMLDDPFRYDLLVVEIDPSLADALAGVLADKTAVRLHQPRYSMISNPAGGPAYQNSNQWVLEVIAVAQGRLHGIVINDRWGAHHYYRENGYGGSVIDRKSVV